MSIIEKMVEIQRELKAPKNQLNKFGGYKYRSCEDILEAVKPLLAKHGLFMMISDSIEYHSETRVYVTATVTVTDGEKELKNTSSAREAGTKKGMDESQITGAASSYARKYALNGMFGIDDTKDADATNTHGKKHSEQPSGHSEHYQWAQLLIGHMTRSDSEALLDEWESKDQEYQSAAWSHIGARERSQIKEMLKTERENRA